MLPFSENTATCYLRQVSECKHALPFSSASVSTGLACPTLVYALTSHPPFLSSSSLNTMLITNKQGYRAVTIALSRAGLLQHETRRLHKLQILVVEERSPQYTRNITRADPSDHHGSSWHELF